MDNTYCCVPQCRSRGNAFPRTSFHHFPRITHVRNQWILKLKMGKEISKTMVVCGKHFQKSDYFPGGKCPFSTRTGHFPLKEEKMFKLAGISSENERRKRRLKQHAVPSQNLPVGWGSSETEETLKNIKETGIKQEERANFLPDDFESEDSDSSGKTKEKKKLNKSDLIIKPKDETLFTVSETIQTSDQDSDTEMIHTSDKDSDIETSSESRKETSDSENESSLEDSNCEINKPSEDYNTEQILREELKIMRDKYKKAREQKQWYKFQYKQCIKHVQCLEKVIKHLKEINSIREDC